MCMVVVVVVVLVEMSFLCTTMCVAIIQTCSEHGVVYCILTSRCASCHNGVHFFNTSASKSAPALRCIVHFDFEMCFAPQGRAIIQHLNFQKCSGVEVYCAFWLRNVLRATTACNYSTSELPKVLRRWGVLCLLTSKCASRHNGVQLFNISTSKSAPALRCIVPFDFEMCFAPQRRAIIQHLNFQKCSGVEVYCAFWLRHVLRATTACNYSTSLISSDGSAPAALASLLFDPAEPQNIGKNTVSRDSSTFSCTCIFFLLTLSLLWSTFFCLSSLLWLFPPLLPPKNRFPSKVPKCQATCPRTVAQARFQEHWTTESGELQSLKTCSNNGMERLKKN